MTEAELEEALMDLVEKGMVDVTYNENLEAEFKITDLGVKAVEEFKRALG